ncbi:MAG: F0F1 ATP synthase subunit delta [Ornithinimicrobium sp.]|uniref:F0F1 ATP synthase subunit delta n=1 Tax=Ornithinimicrobium sp. TaxID=1977084 RepID=UPI0026DF7DC6|nr:F0F1 ATP synthase subunit delta [Ornithinimicrobium sp.]MDO5740957.1 F0F1 ATP synthase subunit delta [Ornithinimicrobium sp.]
MDSTFRRSYRGAREALEEVLQADQGALDASTVAEEVWAVARAVDANAALRRNLADPSREGADKAALAAHVLQGKIGVGAMHVVKATAGQRWRSAGDLVTALDRLGVEAALAHAERQGSLGQLEDDLFRFSRIVEGSPELQAALSDPRADGTAKSVLVDRLLSTKSTPEAVSLVKQAVAGIRGRRFERAIEAYLQQIAERQDEVTATVTTATALDPAQHDQLVAALSRQYGRTVHTNVVIDEDVVGGIRVEIGDEVIDGTISQRLADARRRMTS